MTLITYDEMKAALERAVAERGEGYVYPGNGGGGCSYYKPDGSPDCLIGLAVSYIRPDVRLQWGTYAEEALFDIADSRAVRLAHIAQHQQDTRAPWGHALKIAVGGTTP